MSEHTKLRVVTPLEVADNTAAMARYTDAAGSARAAKYLAGRLGGAARGEWAQRRYTVGVVGSQPASGHDAHRGKLAIPYRAANGDIVQIRFRCMADHDCSEYGHGKYATLSGDAMRLYNVQALQRRSDSIHVTEGELCAMALEACGFDAVAVPGVTHWRPRTAKLLAGYSEVWVWPDGDRPGRDMAAEIKASLPGSTRIIPMPEGVDASDLLCSEGVDALRGMHAEMVVR